MSIRRTLSTISAAVLAGVLSSVMLAAPASAAENCNLGGFEIDGDTPANCTPTAFDDWATTGPAFVANDAGTYSASSKDVNDPSTWTAAGNSPDKADIDTIASLTRVGADGHTYVYLAWTRLNNTGTGKFAVEITAAGANVVNTGADIPTPQPNRSEGGIVMYVQFQGAALPVFQQVCSYTSQANYPNSTNFDATTCGPVDATKYASASSDDGLFFEIALDATSLLGLGASCPADGVTLYLRGVTGGSDHGNLKSFADPITADGASNCIPAKPVLPSTGSTDSAPIGLAAGFIALAGLFLVFRARKARNA